HSAEMPAPRSGTIVRPSRHAFSMSGITALDSSYAPPLVMRTSDVDSNTDTEAFQGHREAREPGWWRGSDLPHQEDLDVQVGWYGGLSRGWFAGATTVQRMPP